jgi:hypothetical protein
VLTACRRAGVRFSVTARLDKAVHRAIVPIPEEAWVPIPYWSSAGTFGEDEQGQPISGADVAEISYTAFGKKGMRVRLIVRRVRPTPGSQLALFAEFRYHALVTDREGTTLELEADHRCHAEVEAVTRDLKEEAGLAHLPSGQFAANAAWLAFSTMAHNLARWVVDIGLPEQLPARTTTGRLRLCLFSVPGRRTRSARRVTVHLSQRWPWQQLFLNALSQIRAAT